MSDISQRNYPFVANLKRIMKEKGLSDEELSTKSEITVDDLRKILYNKKVAGPFEMAMLAKALEEDMNAFFIEENDA